MCDAPVYGCQAIVSTRECLATYMEALAPNLSKVVKSSLLHQTIDDSAAQLLPHAANKAVSPNH